MDSERLEHYRTVLLEQLRQHDDNVRGNQADALELGAEDDGVKDAADMSLRDHNQELELRLGEHESRIVADIDQALLRMDEGSYGVCARCGQQIDERRLDALPTARYDAKCQTEIEAATGEDDNPTL